MKTKLLQFDKCRIKSADGNARQFEGYASVFGNVDSHGDIVLPGAFKATLENRDRPVRMRWNHFGPVIGKWLEIKEDDTGLFVRGELTPDHSVANDVAASMGHGAIDGMSIGYVVREEESTGNHTLLKSVELFEVSVVEEPANAMAVVGNFKVADINSLDFGHLADAEKFLRLQCGFSQNAAKAFVSRVKNIEEERREAVKESNRNTRVAALCDAIKSLEIQK